MAMLDPAEMQIAAAIFAKEFKAQGLFSGQDSVLGKMQREIKEATEKRIEGDEEVAESSENLADKLDDSGDSVNSFRQIINRAGQNIATYFSAAALSKGVGDGIKDFSAQLSSGAIDTGGVLDQMWRSWELAVDPEVLSDLQNANRAAVIAMGGVEQWAAGLEQSRDALFKYTGDIPEALKLASASFETMRIAGINPVTDMLIDSKGELGTFGQSMRDIGLLTKMNMAEVNEMIVGFVKTEEVRRRILGRQDRELALAELTQRQDMLVTMGYMGEEAERAGTALDKLAGDSPKDRMKKAAQAMAALGAAGMGAEGQEVRKMMMLGNRQGGVGTLEGAERMTEIMGRYQERIAKTQYASFGAELAQSTIYQKQGMEWSQDFINMATEEEKSRLADTKANKKTVGENQRLAVDALRTTKIWQARVLDHPLMAAMLGGIGTITSLLKGMTLIMLRREMMGKFGGRTGGAISRFMTGGVGAGGKGVFAQGRFLGSSKLAGKAGATGGAVAIAGLMAMTTSFFQGVEKAAEDENATIGTIVGAGFEEIGNDIMDILPGAFRDGLNRSASAISDAIFNFWHGDDIKDAEVAAVRKANMAKVQSMMKTAKRADFSSTGEFGAQKAFQNALLGVASSTEKLMNFSDKNELLNISELLKELNLETKEGKSLTFEQLKTLAEIAADGKVTQEEQIRANRLATLGNVRAKQM